MRIPYSVTYSGDLRLLYNQQPKPLCEVVVVVGFKCTHIQYYYDENPSQRYGSHSPLAQL